MNKLPVTYMIASTGFVFSTAPVTRIMTENLKRNKKIEPYFISKFLDGRIIGEKIQDQYCYILRNDDSPISNYMKRNSLRVTSVLYTLSDKYKNEILESIKTEYVLITCSTIFSIPLIKLLLEHDKKIVIGGSVANNESFNSIRNHFIKIGTNEDNLKNLIIVSGYVDLTTDIYKIIQEWKDMKIVENDFSTFYECYEDFLNDSYKLFKNFSGYPELDFCISFKNSCWWKRCKFCDMTHENEQDFIKNSSANNIVNYIKTMTKKQQTKNIYISDPYIIFTDKVLEILDQLKDYNITAMTGVKLLLNEEYTKNLCKYVNHIKIGLESTSDFTLKEIDKGYTYEDILIAFDNLSKYSQHDKTIYILHIFDLPSLNVEDINENYRRILKIKQNMENKGFINVYLIHGSLHLFPNSKLIDSEYITVVDRDSNDLSGIWTHYNHLKDIGVNIPSLENLVLPYQRYDINNNLLSSDFYCTDKTLMNDILNSFACSQRNN